MERTMLTFGGRGTSTQVLLSMRALYSSHIACFQLGSRRAWNRDFGIGEELVTCKLYLGLAFIVPTLERVTIGYCEVGGGGGGGGGVIGGVGVVCGDGVDSRVGGVVSRRSAMGEVSRLSSKNYYEGGLVGVMEPKGKTVSSNVTWREIMILLVFRDVIVDGGGGEDIKCNLPTPVPIRCVLVNLGFHVGLNFATYYVYLHVYFLPCYLLIMLSSVVFGVWNMLYCTLNILFSGNVTGFVLVCWNMKTKRKLLYESEDKLIRGVGSKRQIITGGIVNSVSTDAEFFA
ncbi:hypothetical protein Tco_1176350 [Tanacetum coccineum]